MRKEIVLAIVAGLALGLVVAFGLWRASQALKAPQISDRPTPSPTANNSQKITIAKPETGSVIVESPTTISGITKPFAWVIISGESDGVIQADAKGEFQSDFDLSAGVNKIKITVLDESGFNESENITLVYSTEFAKLTNPIATASPSGTTESDIREKVQKKVEEILKNPKAYFGTVTGISENTFQIKSSSGEIKQAVVSTEGTSVVQVGKANKEIKISDIAIGDYIVAMGFSSSSSGSRNGNGVLDTRRILVTSQPAEPDRRIYMGRVETVGKKEVTIKLSGGNEEVKFVPAPNSKIKISEIKPDSLLIIVGFQEKDSFQIRTLKIL